MLAAPVPGSTDPTQLAELAKEWIRSKHGHLVQALSGQDSAHHRVLVALHLAHIDSLDDRIECLNQEIAGRLQPSEADLARLMTIPGVG